MLLACYSHKHISYRIRTIIRKAIPTIRRAMQQSHPSVKHWDDTLLGKQCSYSYVRDAGAGI
ncbi:hypothetical protein [Wolbachia endosymbiont (group A) of Oxytorus armatus]|uniref:hypothetical protein n=1 Tax=Wolbachia endosymbiont (group A) of Oxytorus armatus TaxID=3066211 RepID=UPI0031329BA0